MVKELRKNNMARKNGPGFKMKRSDTPVFKMMGGNSPIRNLDDKFATMNTTYDSVTGDMTDDKLRELTVAQHGSKAHKFNVDFRTMQKLRNQRKKKIEETKVEPEINNEEQITREYTGAFAMSPEDQTRIQKEFGLGVLSTEKQKLRTQAYIEAEQRFYQSQQ